MTEPNQYDIDIGKVLREEYYQILSRYNNPNPNSRTTQMLQAPAGVETKLMEEAFEVAKASMGNEGVQRQSEELADVMYALTAYMVQNGITWEQLAQEMSSRQKK